MVLNALNKLVKVSPEYFLLRIIKFLQQNINQSETGTGDKKLSVELYATKRLFPLINE